MEMSSIEDSLGEKMARVSQAVVALARRSWACFWRLVASGCEGSIVSSCCRVVSACWNN